MAMDVASEWSELSGCFYTVIPVSSMQWEVSYCANPSFMSSRLCVHKVGIQA